MTQTTVLVFLAILVACSAGCFLWGMRLVRLDILRTRGHQVGNDVPFGGRGLSLEIRKNVMDHVYAITATEWKRQEDLHTAGLMEANNQKDVVIANLQTELEEAKEMYSASRKATSIDLVKLGTFCEEDLPVLAAELHDIEQDKVTAVHLRRTRESLVRWGMTMTEGEG